MEMTEFPHKRSILLGYFTKSLQTKTGESQVMDLIFSNVGRNVPIILDEELSNRIYQWRNFLNRGHQVIIFSNIYQQGILDIPLSERLFIPNVKDIALIDLGSFHAAEKEGINTKLENIRWAIRRTCSALCSEPLISVIEVDPCDFPKVAAEAAVYGAFYRNGIAPNIPQQSYYFDLDSLPSPVSIQHLQCSDNRSGAYKESLKSFEKGLIIGESQNFARMLHGPAFFATSEEFIKRLEQKCMATQGINFFCRDEAWMKQMKMESIMQVNFMNKKCNSFGKYYDSLHHPSYLLEIHYNGSSTSKPVLLTGKASFDHLYESYLQIERRQPVQHIQNVSAGASIAATVLALARLNVPLNVKGIIPICVHSLSLRKRNKIKNLTETDIYSEVPDSHEERLILKDAVSYSSTFDPEVIITVATQTSYLTTTFESSASVLYSSCDLMSDLFLQICSFTGEKFIRLPFIEIEDDIFNECVIKKQFCRDCRTIFRGPISAEIKNELIEYISKKSDLCFITSLSLKDLVLNKKWLHLEVNRDLLIIQDDDDEIYKLHAVTGAPTRSLIEFCQQILQYK